MNESQEQLVHKMHRLVNGNSIEAEYKFIALQGSDGLYIAKRYEGQEDYRQLDNNVAAEMIDSYSADVKGLLEIIDQLKAKLKESEDDTSYYYEQELERRRYWIPNYR